MKKYKNSTQLLNDMRNGKIKNNESILLDERLKRDVFLLSMGNRTVLENIPRMMEFPNFRRELRKLTLSFLTLKRKMGEK